MKIIGHRGAAGLELENTIPSFKKALELGVDMIECDVRLTKDGKIVVSHDDNLDRVGGGNNRISQLTYKDLRNITLRNGERVPTMLEVLQTIDGRVPLVIEIKVKRVVDLALKDLEPYPNQTVIFASPVHSEIIRLKKVRPDIKGYLRSNVLRPVGIYATKRYKADGLDLTKWFLNPITYGLCRLLGLDVMVYTVNSKWGGNIIRRLYPHVMLCTNYPDRFLHKR